jgi:hypothetical protein
MTAKKIDLFRGKNRKNASTQFLVQNILTQTVIICLTDIFSSIVNLYLPLAWGVPCLTMFTKALETRAFCLLRGVHLIIVYIFGLQPFAA